MHFQGLLYRALNPQYAQEPFSGRGAQRYGGRFNARGTPALYTSLSIETAIKEANQVGSLQPTTLVAYRADIKPIFDTRDTTALAEFGLTPADLATRQWRDLARRHDVVPTQELARFLFQAGYAGLLTRSFAAGTSVEDLNLVLWRWGRVLPAQLQLIDDEHRLRKR